MKNSVSFLKYNVLCLVFLYIPIIIQGQTIKRKDINLNNLYDKIQYHINKKSIDSASIYAEEYLELYDNLIIKRKKREYAEVLALCGAIYSRLFQFKKSEYYINKCIKICTDNEFDDIIRLTQIQIIQCVNFTRLGNYDKSITQAKTLLGHYNENSIKNSQDSLVNFLLLNFILGVAYLETSFYDSATFYFNRAIKYQISELPTKTSISKDMILMRHSYASLLIHKGEYDNAYEFILETESLINNIDFFEFDYDYLLMFYGNLAFIYKTLGDFVKAEEYFLKAEEISIQRPHLKNAPYYIVFLNNLRDFYDDTGRTDKTFEVTKRIYNFFTDYQNASDYQKANELYLLALEYLKFEEHIYYVELTLLDALDYLRKTAENNINILYPKILLALSQVYLFTEDYSESEKNLLEAYESNLNIGVYNTYLHSEIIHELARVYSKTGLIKKADSLANISLDIYNKLHNQIGIVERNWGSIKLFYELKNYEKVQELIKNELNLFQQNITNYILTLTEREKTQLLQEYNHTFFTFFSFYLNFMHDYPYFLEELINYRLFTKGVILNFEKKLRNRIIASNDKYLLDKYNEWLKTKQILSNLVLESNINSKDINQQIDSLSSVISKIEKQLNKLSSNYEIEINQRNYNWRDIQKGLNYNEAAIEIIRFPYYYKNWTKEIYYAACIITSESNNFPNLVVLKNGTELENSIYDNYSKSICNPYSKEKIDPVFFNKFWEPIDSIIPDKNRIYISADGVYNKINILTLVTPNGEYVIDNKDIIMVTSLTDLIDEGNFTVKQNKYAVLVGNPKFDMDSSQLNIVSKEYSRSSSFDYYLNVRGRLSLSPVRELPGTKVEIDDLGYLLKENKWEFDVLTGENALEGAVKGKQNPKILHMATHGYFFEDSTKNISSKENPMFQSGLLLAGANRTIQGNYSFFDDFDDGILTAYEVMNMKLDSTELVVLSACETGLGQITNGEGVYGLQRAFHLAGANYVMMSLWKVDDFATQKLMIDFYRNWFNGMSKHKALRFAQNKLRYDQKYNHPFYWGSFLIIGD